MSAISLAASAQTTPVTTHVECEVWVAVDGDDAGAGTSMDRWATIQHAVDAAPDEGCIVRVGPGTYPGGVDISRRFATPLILRGAQGYQTVLEHSSTVVNVDGALNVVVEGFEIRHSDPDAQGFIVSIDRGKNGLWSESVTLRNNIIHDSYDNDLVKIHAGVRRAVVEGNVFYNQGESEQHIDVNSVTDVVIQDNIFFNDFERSGRSQGPTKHFIVIKDSGHADDGLVGSRRITVRRNVFMNWEGGREALVRVGNDGKPYFEAAHVQIESNLFLANSGRAFDAPVGVSGARGVAFVNNTVVGDLSVGAFGFRAQAKGSNPKNEDIVFANNIWSDPKGRMSRFNSGEASRNVGLVLDNNLFWNGGLPIAGGVVVDPGDDRHIRVADPQLPGSDGAVLPVWNGTAFDSGNRRIREEFMRLVIRHATVSPNSPVVDSASASCAAATDITGRHRDSSPDIGAWEASTSPPEPSEPGPAIGDAGYPFIGDLAFGCESERNDRFPNGDSIVHCHVTSGAGPGRWPGLERCII